MSKLDIPYIFLFFIIIFSVLTRVVWGILNITKSDDDEDNDKG